MYKKKNIKIYDAVIAGYTCVDLTVDFRNERSSADLSDILKPGKLVEIDGLGFSLGGVVSNTGAAMKKFGKKVFLNGLVGDDFAGEVAIKNFNDWNLSDGIYTTSESGTALSIVLAPQGVDRIFLESIGCSQIFNINHINFSAIDKSRLFHFGYPPLLKQFYLDGGHQLIDLFSKIHQMGVVTSLDFSLPDLESESGKLNWSDILQKVCPSIDIFVPSLEEVLHIMNFEKLKEIKSSSKEAEMLDKIPVKVIREMGKKILEWGVRILLIKAGHNGAYLLAGDVSTINDKSGFKLDTNKWSHCELWCNAYSADVSKITNSCGAGDTAVAGFLSAILNAEDPDLSLKYAAIAGRNNLYCKNLFNDLSDWQEMVKEIKSEANEIIDFKLFGKNKLSDIPISLLKIEIKN